MVSQDGEHVGYKYQMRKSQVGLGVTKIQDIVPTEISFPGVYLQQTIV